MTEKPEQVVWLERVLKRPLHHSTSGSITDRNQRKCFQLDEQGNISGLNLYSTNISDWSFFK